MIEILTIGDELTSGSTLDENARFIARALYGAGLQVARITTVGDGIDDIVGMLQHPLVSTRCTIVTGGLGPTDDDRTAEAAAKAFGVGLQSSPEALALMQQKFAGLGRTMNPANLKQALLPDNARVVPNPVGTACGFLISHGQRQAVFLPGVPEEVQAMTASFLLAYVQGLFCSGQVISHQILKVFGLRESVIQEKIAGALPVSSTVVLGYYPQYPEVSIKITGRGQDAVAVRQEIERFRAVLYERIGDYIYADTDTPLEEVVAGLLRQRGATLAVAESCTGGLLAHRLTNVPGSSQYMDRGLVVYSNRAKEELLGVPAALLQQQGAVSEPVARHMAEAVRQRAGTSFGLAITGIAGPAGGSPEKPVGTVFIGIAGPAQTIVSHHRLHGSRQQIRLMGAHAALNLLRQAVLAGPGAPCAG